MKSIVISFIYFFLSLSLLAADASRAHLRRPGPMSRAKKIWTALDDFKREYNKLIQIGDKQLLTRVDFLVPEHQLEAQTFFDLKWDDNQRTLSAFAELIGDEGEGFKRKDGFTAISVGSLVSHVYYVVDGSIRSQAYPFGNKLSPHDQNNLTALSDAFKLIKGLNRPCIFFNAISYAKIRGIFPMENTATFIDLNDEIRFETDDDATHAGRMAGILGRLVKEHQIKRAYVHQTPKILKLAYGWTTAVVKSLPHFSDGTHFIADFSNSSFSAKPVRDFVVEDINVVKKDKYDDNEAIALELTGKSAIHPNLRRYMDSIIADVKSFITQNPARFRNQDEIYLLFGFTGNISAIFHKYAGEVADENRFEQDEKRPRAEDVLPPYNPQLDLPPPSAPPAYQPLPSAPPAYQHYTHNTYMPAQQNDQRADRSSISLPHFNFMTALKSFFGMG